MTTSLISGLLICVASSATGVAPNDCAFFEQWTIAAHDADYGHGLPSMARLGDGRIFVAWARNDVKTSDFVVVGAFSPDEGCTWTPPRVFFEHKDAIDADPSIVVSGHRVLLTCTTASFAEGIRTSATWCVRSEDDGLTWSEPYEIPMNHRYTCGKCHRGLRLKSGRLLMGYSWDALCEKGEALKTEGEMDLRAGVMRSTDSGMTWTNGGDTTATYAKVSGGAVSGTDEPAIVELEDGSIYMLLRTGADHLFEARSTDEGQTWKDIQQSPLTGSNAPAALCNLRADGRQGILAVWDNAVNRFPLCAAASFDGGKTWSPPKDIGFPYTEGQASYPSCEQMPDGTILAVWQQDVPGGRDVRLARFSPAWLLRETQTMTIVTFGDSTTANRGPLRTFSQILSDELTRRGTDIRVINAGIGGNTTEDARARFERNVISHNPDVVTLSFGINDSTIDVWDNKTQSRVTAARYEENLRYFVTTLKARGAHPILLTPNPMRWTAQLKGLYAKPPYDPNNDDGMNTTLTPYAERVREIAKTENVPLLDVYRLFEDYAAANRIPIDHLLLDGMHPNDFGHHLIADALRDLLADTVPRPSQK